MYKHIIVMYIKDMRMRNSMLQKLVISRNEAKRDAERDEKSNIS